MSRFMMRRLRRDRRTKRVNLVVVRWVSVRGGSSVQGFAASASEKGGTHR